MNYILEGHSFEYEVQSITQIFFPNEKFIKVKEVTTTGLTVVSVVNKNLCTSSIFEDGVCKSEEKIAIDGTSEIKYLIKKSTFIALKKITNQKTPWGMLTGIRPSKIIHELWSKGFSNTEVSQYMIEVNEVSKEKTDLCIQVAEVEKNIIKDCTDDIISIYIGIPFCPSICLYCSFASSHIKKFEGLVDDYLNALIKEMKYIKSLCANKKINTVYVGGGTPTSLNELQLEKLLQNIKECFNLNEVLEYTVEAGRPDSLNEKKLKLLKKYGVSRISINPQTMNDDSLRLIGRNHNVKEFIESFEIARRTGHNNINIDLIVGLPNEEVKDVTYTLNKIKELNAESITVHTLAIKRASRLKETLEEYNFSKFNTIEKMLQEVSSFAKENNLYPYYMYRQKNMVGNFENVGYCKKGKECIYNIKIMEEKQTIVAIGAGAITKRVILKTNKIDRIFNVKDVLEYIKRIDEMIERKRKGFEEWL